MSAESGKPVVRRFLNACGPDSEFPSGCQKTAGGSQMRRMICTLAEVVSGMNNVSELLFHITVASSKQFDANRRVTENNLISEVVQTNSATAEKECAAARKSEEPSHLQALKGTGPII